MPASATGVPETVWLLGHEIRWRLAQALSNSDHRVGELVETVGERQNLVSYHLGLLRRAGVVSERRSSDDARDIYYHLDLDGLGSRLNQAAIALHPALYRSAEIQPVPRLAPARLVRVLFICTGNSARSQIAEAMLRKQSGGRVQVHSAGTQPTQVHPLAVQVLSRRGIETQGLRSKGLEEVGGIDFDYVITLCDIAREQCPSMPRDPEFIHWSLSDPATMTGAIGKRRAAFRSTADEIAVRVRQFLQLIAIKESTPARMGGKSYG